METSIDKPRKSALFRVDEPVVISHGFFRCSARSLPSCGGNRIRAVMRWERPCHIRAKASAQDMPLRIVGCPREWRIAEREANSVAGLFHKRSKGLLGDNGGSVSFLCIGRHIRFAVQNRAPIREGNRGIANGIHAFTSIFELTFSQLSITARYTQVKTATRCENDGRVGKGRRWVAMCNIL